MSVSFKLEQIWPGFQFFCAKAWASCLASTPANLGWNLPYSVTKRWNNIVYVKMSRVPDYFLAPRRGRNSVTEVWSSCITPNAIGPAVTGTWWSKGTCTIISNDTVPDGVCGTSFLDITGLLPHFPWNCTMYPGPEKTVLAPRHKPKVTIKCQFSF